MPTPEFELVHGRQIPLLRREQQGLAAEEQNQALVQIGLFHTGEKFRFLCPLCGRVEVNDQRMEPMCTGPSWTDDHPMELMILQS